MMLNRKRRETVSEKLEVVVDAFRVLSKVGEVAADTVEKTIPKSK